MSGVVALIELGTAKTSITDSPASVNRAWTRPPTAQTTGLAGGLAGDLAGRLAGSVASVSTA